MTVDFRTVPYVTDTADAPVSTGANLRCRGRQTDHQRHVTFTDRPPALTVRSRHTPHSPPEIFVVEAARA